MLETQFTRERVPALRRTQTDKSQTRIGIVAVRKGDKTSHQAGHQAGTLSQSDQHERQRGRRTRVQDKAALPDMELSLLPPSEHG